ncbi:AAA family ATPase [Sulfurovum sp. zt1-1]|uniref:DNA repair protein RecN n=1 Tax=Sulfurovum zhangzhouensis TaxID=3019067 RepID=A0ABT7QY44_9BACT|nr:AAA family ATPase [Sulfurovum zhangzhouensis]MDM5271752.1 AAA family ATPase [Sulfurovum zhangzhouensis]
MIERLYLRDLVTFSEAEVEFEKGLVVFTGPSGAGKSVLMSAILSSFGHTTPGAAALCEVNLAKPESMESEAYTLEADMTIKTLKKENVRHYIDGQNISKKILRQLFTPYVQYLSVRDKGGFESEILLAMIESSLCAKDKTYTKLSKEYTKRYAIYKNQLFKLNKIKEDEAKLAELIEFARYEIDKIEKIDPRAGEDEELIQVKQQLSRIDKIKEMLQYAAAIFDAESSVQEVYRLLDKDASVFTDAMNQVRMDFEETESLAEELEEMDVEQILDRLSDLTALKNRYGSIEEALIYKEEKQQELAGYENIEQDKSMLENFIVMEAGELHVLAQQLSSYRKKEAKEIEEKLTDYLAALKLPKLSFTVESKPFDESGSDVFDVLLGGSSADTLSGGEFNRVRLALMASTIGQENRGGVLILDEIDANVSGDESIAIAEMISQLSKVYQIFAISHQPHLSAKADQHFVVNKEAQKSEVRSLDNEGRIQEIARIIAGENPTPQALEFAKKLRS